MTDDDIKQFSDPALVIPAITVYGQGFTDEWLNKLTDLPFAKKLFSISLVDTAVTAGTYFYVVTAQDVAGNVSTASNEAAVMVLADTTPPTVTLTAPADGATVTGSISVTATASDDVKVAGVQFQLDGLALGAERTTAPYAVTWNTASATNASSRLPNRCGADDDIDR